jgi:uncharacterized membrane protein
MGVMRWLALASGALLIALSLIWEIWLAPVAYAPPAVWATIKALPLAVLLPALWRDRPRVYFAGCLLGLLYFCEGVVLAYAHRAEPWAAASVRPWAWAEIALALVFFFSAALRLRRLRASAGTES